MAVFGVLAATAFVLIARDPGPESGSKRPVWHAWNDPFAGARLSQDEIDRLSEDVDAALAEERWADAAKGLEKIAEDPGRGMRLSNAAYVWLMAGDVRRAQRDYDRFVRYRASRNTQTSELNGEPLAFDEILDADFLTEKAAALAVQNRKDRASRALRQAESVLSNLSLVNQAFSAEWRILIAAGYLDIDEPANALRVAETALSLIDDLESIMDDEFERTTVNNNSAWDRTVEIATYDLQRAQSWTIVAFARHALGDGAWREAAATARFKLKTAQTHPELQTYADSQLAALSALID